MTIVVPKTGAKKYHIRNHRIQDDPIKHIWNHNPMVETRNAPQVQPIVDFLSVKEGATNTFYGMHIQYTYIIL